VVESSGARPAEPDDDDGNAQRRQARLVELAPGEDVDDLVQEGADDRADDEEPAEQDHEDHGQRDEQVEDRLGSMYPIQKA
jgi:hypothetical protein